MTLLVEQQPNLTGSTIEDRRSRYAERSASDTASGLWEKWRASPTTEHRDALVRHYWPLVRTAAAAVKRPRHLALDELESHASLGLLDALQRYDPARGPFEQYALLRMRGAVLDGVRSHDRLKRVNLDRAKALRAAEETLTDRLRRPPSDAELAAQLGVTVDGLRPFHNARMASTVTTLDLPAGADTADARHRPSDARAEDVGHSGFGSDVAAEVEHRLRQTMLAAALDRIVGPDRAVLVLYYVAELTMSDIAKVLGVSTARVCQIHTRAVRALKADLQPTLPSLEEQL